MFVGLHFLYLWLPRWLWAEAILWWLEKSDSSIWGRSGGLLPPRGYPNYPCFVQISRQRHLSASSERPKTCGHCVLAQRYCCQKSSHTTLESYTLSVTCKVRTTFLYLGSFTNYGDDILINVDQLDYHLPCWHLQMNCLLNVVWERPLIWKWDVITFNYSKLIETLFFFDY